MLNMHNAKLFLEGAAYESAKVLAERKNPPPKLPLLIVQRKVGLTGTECCGGVGGSSGHDRGPVLWEAELQLACT